MSIRLKRPAARAALLIAATFGMAGCAAMSHGGSSAAETFALVVNNRSDQEVVVYAVPAPGAVGTRLANARSFAITNVKVAATDLQGGNGIVLRIHPIGVGNASRDWVSPRVTLSGNSVAKLDVRGDSFGDLSTSSLYTAPPSDPRSP